ncbi:MAG: signal peptidase [Fimbriimonadaceae bacterium]|nr:signal peptidase [Fimbriimonadaceae bacterium]
MLFSLAQMEQGPSKFQQLFDQLARTPLSQVLAFVAVCTVLRLAVFPYLAKALPHKRGGVYSGARLLNEFLDAVIYAGVVVFMLIRPFGVQTFLIPSGSMLDTLLINDFIIANKAVYRYTDPKRGDIIVFKPPPAALDASQKDVDFIKRLIGAPGDVVEVHDGSLFRNGKKLEEPYLRDQGMMNDWKLVHYQGPYKAWQGLYIPVYYQKSRDLGATANWQSSSGTARAYAVGFDESMAGQDRSVPRPESWKMRVEDFTPEERARMAYLVAAPPAAVPPGYYLMMGDNRNNSYDSRGWGLVPRANIVGRSEVIWWPPSRWSRTKSIKVGEDAGH